MIHQKNMSNDTAAASPHRDRRTLRTRRAIRAALLRLLREKSSQEITVTELARAADINRKTFYNYYTGVPAVIDELEDEIAGRVSRLVWAVDFTHIGSDPETFLCHIAVSIRKTLDTYGDLFASDLHPQLETKIAASLKDQLLQIYHQTVTGQHSAGSLNPRDTAPQAESDLVEFIIDYTVNGMTAVYRKWYESDRSLSLQELSRRLGFIMISGVSGLLSSSGFGTDKKS